MALTVNQGWRWIRGHKSALIALIFWLVLIVAVRQYMQATDLTFGELSARLQTVLSESWYGPLLYILVYLARPLILFPASLLTILGGSVFGLWPGFLYVLIAGTVSAIIPYGIGRWLSSGQPPPTQSPTAAGRFVRMLRENPFVAVLTMRLIYLPYDAVSLLAGSLRISFVAFLAATALGNLAGTLSFVGIGASIEGDLAAGEISLNPQVLVFSFTILVLSLVLSRLLKRGERRLQAQEIEGAE